LIIDTPSGETLITFPIRQGVKFHKGGDLTAEDVKYSFLRKLTLEGPGGESAVVLQSLIGFESLDAWAVAFEPGIETFSSSLITRLLVSSWTRNGQFCRVHGRGQLKPGKTITIRQKKIRYCMLLQTEQAHS